MSSTSKYSTELLRVKVLAESVSGDIDLNDWFRCCSDDSDFVLICC
jgi:hypothetical protein